MNNTFVKETNNVTKWKTYVFLQHCVSLSVIYEATEPFLCCSTEFQRRDGFLEFEYINASDGLVAHKTVTVYCNQLVAISMESLQ